MADTKEKKMKSWKELSKKQKGIIVGTVSAVVLGVAGAITGIVLKNKNNKDDADIAEVEVVEE